MPQASTLRDEHDQRDVAFAEDEAEYRHEQGEDVDYFPGKRQTPQVVFEGAGILVVYKPPHWTMTTTAEMPRDKSMQAWLGDTIGRRCKYLREDPLQSGLVQRLDVETSGPVVVATERGTFNKMWQLRAAGHFYREYRVLMHGLLPLKRCAGTLNYSLDTGRKFTKVCERNGQLSRTRYQAVAAFFRESEPGEPPGRRYYTLIRARILTGRMHQIRVHFRELAVRLGFSICGVVGDYRYLPRAEVMKDWAYCPRVFLHAKVLRFPLPSKRGGLCSVNCDLPLDLTKVLRRMTVDEEMTRYYKCLPDFLHYEQTGDPAPDLQEVLEDVGLDRQQPPRQQRRSFTRSPSRWRGGDASASEGEQMFVRTPHPGDEDFASGPEGSCDEHESAPAKRPPLDSKDRLSADVHTVFRGGCDEKHASTSTTGSVAALISTDSSGVVTGVHDDGTVVQVRRKRRKRLKNTSRSPSHWCPRTAPSPARSKEEGKDAVRETKRSQTPPRPVKGKSDKKTKATSEAAPNQLRKRRKKKAGEKSDKTEKRAKKVLQAEAAPPQLRKRRKKEAGEKSDKTEKQAKKVMQAEVLTTPRPLAGVGGLRKSERRKVALATMEMLESGELDTAECGDGKMDELAGPLPGDRVEDGDFNEIEKLVATQGFGRPGFGGGAAEPDKESPGHRTVYAITSHRVVYDSDGDEEGEFHTGDLKQYSQGSSMQNGVQLRGKAEPQEEMDGASTSAPAGDSPKTSSEESPDPKLRSSESRSLSEQRRAGSRCHEHAAKQDSLRSPRSLHRSDTQINRQDVFRLAPIADTALPSRCRSRSRSHSRSIRLRGRSHIRKDRVVLTVGSPQNKPLRLRSVSRCSRRRDRVSSRDAFPNSLTRSASPKGRQSLASEQRRNGSDTGQEASQSAALVSDATFLRLDAHGPAKCDEIVPSVTPNVYNAACGKLCASVSSPSRRGLTTRDGDGNDPTELLPVSPVPSLAAQEGQEQTGRQRRSPPRNEAAEKPRMPEPRRRGDSICSYDQHPAPTMLEAAVAERPAASLDESSCSSSHAHASHTAISPSRPSGLFEDLPPPSRPAASLDEGRSSVYVHASPTVVGPARLLGLFEDLPPPQSPARRSRSVSPQPSLLNRDSPPAPSIEKQPPRSPAPRSRSISPGPSLLKRDSPPTPSVEKQPPGSPARRSRSISPQPSPLKRDSLPARRIEKQPPRSPAPRSRSISPQSSPLTRDSLPAPSIEKQPPRRASPSLEATPAIAPEATPAIAPAPAPSAAPDTRPERRAWERSPKTHLKDAIRDTQQLHDALRASKLPAPRHASRSRSRRRNKIDLKVLNGAGKEEKKRMHRTNKSARGGPAVNEVADGNGTEAAVKSHGGSTTKDKEAKMTEARGSVGKELARLQAGKTSVSKASKQSMKAQVLGLLNKQNTPNKSATSKKSVAAPAEAKKAPTARCLFTAASGEESKRSTADATFLVGDSASSARRLIDLPKAVEAPTSRPQIVSPITSKSVELSVTRGPLQGRSFTFSESGASLGRQSTNTVPIPEGGISRHHAAISFEEGGFGIRDLGSTTGTFLYLKPRAPFRLFSGVMVKIGNTQFRALSQKSDDGVRQLSLDFLEGSVSGEKRSVSSEGLTIGRNSDNQLVLAGDGTVSSHHAIISLEGSEFFVTDLGSCNGTCVRLSEARVKSEWHPIVDGDIIGASCTKMRCRVFDGALE